MATADHSASNGGQIPILETVRETVRDEVQREVAPDSSAVEQLSDGAIRLYCYVVSDVQRSFRELRRQIEERIRNIEPEQLNNPQTIQASRAPEDVANKLAECIESIKEQREPNPQSLKGCVRELRAALDKEKLDEEDGRRCCRLSRQIRFEAVLLFLAGELDGNSGYVEQALDLFEQAPRRLSSLEGKDRRVADYLSNIEARRKHLKTLYDFARAPAVSPEETTDFEQVLTELNRVSKRSLSEAEELAKSASGLNVTFDRLVDSVDKSLAQVREASEPLSRIDADIKRLVRECKGLAPNSNPTRSRAND